MGGYPGILDCKKGQPKERCWPRAAGGVTAFPCHYLASDASIEKIMAAV
jgi:hypothetical protein